MKTHLKFIFILVLTLNYKSSAQTDTLFRRSQTIVIRIIESGSYGLLNNVDSRMIVSGTDNEILVKDLKRANYSLNANEGVELNTRTIQTELQKWQKQGFNVKSTSTTATKETVVLTTIVLQKN